MLTAREIQVLRLLSRGCSYAEVARQLGISVNTVGTHVKNAYRRLSVTTAAAAVMRAVELGLLAPQPNGDRRDAGGEAGTNANNDTLSWWLERGELASP